MSDKAIQQWSLEETNALLAIWGTTEIQEKLSGAVRKAKVYEEIRGELEVAGFGRTVDQITNKLKKIKKEYRDHKKELGKSGAGRTKPKSGLNMDFLDNVIGQRPANQVTGSLNSATAMLEQMCDPNSCELDVNVTTCEDDMPVDEPSTPSTSTTSHSTVRKGKRKLQHEDLLERLEKSDEKRDQMLMEHTERLTEAFVTRIDSTSNALLGLMGRIVAVLEKEQ